MQIKQPKSVKPKTKERKLNNDVKWWGGIYSYRAWKNGWVCNCVRRGWTTLNVTRLLQMNVALFDKPFLLVMFF